MCLQLSHDRLILDWLWVNPNRVFHCSSSDLCVLILGVNKVHRTSDVELSENMGQIQRGFGGSWLEGGVSRTPL